MLVSLPAKSFVIFAQEKMKRDRKGRTRWMADSNFQVQRMMYERREYGNWKCRKDAVPVYVGGDFQFAVDLEDGTFGILNRKAIEKVEESSIPMAQTHPTVAITKVPSRSGTVTSFEGLAVEEAASQKA